MNTKKLGCLLITALLFSAFSTFVYTVDALPVATVSFQGVGVTIEITFPEEAHPSESITHNVTITADTTATLRNFTVVVMAPVNSIWQEIYSGEDTTGSKVLPPPVDYTLNLPLPQETNGTLQCFIYVNTTLSADFLSGVFYTTQIHILTFNELLSEYNILSAEYTNQVADYQTLTNQYNELSANYSGLIADYGVLLSENNELFANYSTLLSDFETLASQNDQLLEDYNDVVAEYGSLLKSNESLTNERNTLNSNYNLLLKDYNTLQTDYDLLNSTRSNLKAEYDSLNSKYTNLQTELTNMQERVNFSENALSSNRIILFIFLIITAILVIMLVYLKRKKQKTYIVIRKETDALINEEES
jgi:predicted nuclease with TOPRIM domain